MLYAKVSDVRALENTDGLSSGQITRLIRVASAIMRHETRYCVYNTDSEGLPVKSVFRACFRDAVLAQIELWLSAEVTTQILDGGVSIAPGVKSTSDNGASVTFDTSQADHARAYILSGGVGMEALDNLAPVLETASHPVVSW